MNLILFDEGELEEPLPLDDPRCAHILTVLRRSAGEPFDIGIVDGMRGKGRIREKSDRGLDLDWELREAPESLHPIRLLLGLSRPITMRRLLRDCTSLGVRRIDVVLTERSEPSYASSSLWTAGEYRAHLIEGAQQAFSTRLPEVVLPRKLADILTPRERGGEARADSAAGDGASSGARAPSGAERALVGGTRALARGGLSPHLLALDNYEAEESLGSYLRRLSSGDLHGDGHGAPRVTAPLAMRPDRAGSGERGHVAGSEGPDNDGSAAGRDGSSEGVIAVIAIGGERGWTERERDLLREAGFRLLGLGRRVQRTEVACVAALGILLSGLGLLEDA